MRIILQILGNAEDVMFFKKQQQKMKLKGMTVSLLLREMIVAYCEKNNIDPPILTSDD